VRKPERKRRLSRDRYRWKDNIKMILQEIGLLLGLDLRDSGYGGVAGCFEHGNEPSSSLRHVEYFHQLKNC